MQIEKSIFPLDVLLLLICVAPALQKTYYLAFKITILIRNVVKGDKPQNYK